MSHPESKEHPHKAFLEAFNGGRCGRTLLLSALAKPFLILTGGSGTGKTQLASAFAGFYGNTSKTTGGFPFQVGESVGEGSAAYRITRLTPDFIEIANPNGSLVQFPNDLVKEWISAIVDGRIDRSKGQREQRGIVKEGSVFDSYYHGWTAQLIGLAWGVADRVKADPAVVVRENHTIVPVGADWTDNRQVLGFVNHLRTSSVGEGDTATERPVYQTTPVLDLLLEASRPGNERFPFFLILDEMNLSHVERYFADFLSVMEQRDGVLTLHSEGPREDEHFCLPRYAADPLGVPRTLPYPQNLFVIGTVNVDETTYMFSPKVLDRANVIEFAVESGQIDEFLAAPHEYPEPPKADDGVAEAFLALAKKARLDPDKGGLDALGGTAADEAREHLVTLFEILKRGRFEFAYRTANEVMRYLRVCRYLAAEESDDALSAWDEGGWRNDLDAQIVQKILPKLHGSMGRVGRLLGALTAYCGGADAGAAFHYFPGGREGNDSSITGLPLQNALEPVEGGGHRFSKSRTKLETMIQVLLEEQFVSFIN